MTFSIAILGRPNVGKSTLFNRLTGKKRALVDDTPGVTRDRREGTAQLGGRDVTVVDTAGLDDTPKDDLLSAMQAQTDQAVGQADLLLFLIDARAGLTPADKHFAQILRKTGKPVLVVANKCEGRAGESGLMESYALGMGEPVALSAEHGTGLAALYDAVDQVADQVQPADGQTVDTDVRPLALAIIGRPNAGKSTLINRLLGEDRLLAGPQAGMTRDAISIDWTWADQAVRLIDTAGLRKRARVREKLEKLAVADALEAIRYAEVVVLVIDATKPFDKQDLQIADHAANEGRAIVIAVNKWDLVRDKAKIRRELSREVERLLPQIRGVELVFLSALDGKGLDKLMPVVLKTYKLWNRRIATNKLNLWLGDALAQHPPPAVSGRRLRMRYMTQANARPPTFIVFCSRPDAVPKSYIRYLINGLREVFNLPGVPIRLHLRKGRNPYVSD
jgi:GTP-binding protein